MAALRVGAARADDARDSRRADLRLRSQRHLAAARHERRRRSRRPRAVLQRLRADGRHARVPEHACGSRPAASSSSPRAARRRPRSASTTAACCASRPTAAAPRCSATDSGSRTSASTSAPASSPRATSRATTSRARRLHIVRDGQFYGFLSDKQPREVYPAPIAEPLDVDSARGKRVGHVAGLAVRRAHGTARTTGSSTSASTSPELFRVLLNNRSCEAAGGRREHHPRVRVSAAERLGQSRRRPAVCRGLPDPRLGHDRDAARRPGRVRYTGAASTLPREVVPMDKGVLLRFDVAARCRQRPPIPTTTRSRAGTTSAPISTARRSSRPMARPGIDRLSPSSAYLSNDGRSVFVGVPGMKPVMQMRIGWSLATAAGAKFQETAYFTPYDLPAFNPQAEGFRDVTVDLSPRAASTRQPQARRSAPRRRASPVSGSTAASRATRLTPRHSPGWARPGRACTAVSAPLPAA